MKERDSCLYLEQEWLKSSIKDLYGQELAVKAKFSSDIPAQVIELPPDTLTAPPESWEDAIETAVVSEVATVATPVSENGDSYSFSLSMLIDGYLPAEKE